MSVRTVGITTMHRISNYGSTLQAYGLKRLIESLDAQTAVSFVDFRPGPVLVSEQKTTLLGRHSPRTLQKVLEYNQANVPLRDKLSFFNHKRKYERRYLPLAGIPPTRNYSTDVDLQVIGSDEVFNCVQANVNVGFSPDLFGVGTHARSLVSYAASFGNTTWEKIEDAGIASTLAKHLATFDEVSVRDQNSQDVIVKLTGSAPPIHVDPAIAYDYMRDVSLVTPERLYQEPYLIVYGYSGRLSQEENFQLRGYANSIGAKILSFGGVQDCADEFIDCDPFELLAYFRDSLGVVTDTFHGTILSIINERPFATMARRSVSNHYGNEEKIGYLLQVCGLESQRVSESNSLVDKLTTVIDYAPVNEVIGAERARAHEYLARILGHQAQPSATP